MIFILYAFLISLFIALTSQITAYQCINGYLIPPFKQLFMWPTYLFTNLCTTFLIFPIAIHINLSLSGLSLSIFCWATITAGLCDLTTQLLPRWCTLFMIPVGILFSSLSYGFVDGEESLMAIFFGYTLLWSLELFYKKVLKKDALGEGDKELLAMIGSFLGFQGLLATMIAGGFTGGFLGMLLIKKGKITRETPLPLGFFLCLGSLIYLIIKLNS